MLKLVIPSIVLVLFSCNSTQNSMGKSAQTSTKCPPEIECKAEIIANKTMVLKEDTIGQLYIRLVDKQGTHVIKHSYVKESRPGLADDGYAEIVFFEIEDGTKSLDIEGKELKDHKLIVQKACFCPDAGSEIITEGHLKMIKSNTGYNVEIEYTSSRALKLNALIFSVDK